MNRDTKKNKRTNDQTTKNFLPFGGADLALESILSAFRRALRWTKHADVADDSVLLASLRPVTPQRVLFLSHSRYIALPPLPSGDAYLARSSYDG